MNTKKFIIFNLVQSILIVIFAYKAFFNNFGNETVLSFLSSNVLSIGILLLISVITLFVNISFIVPQVIRKKNLLKIAFIFQLGLVIYSIYLLFTEQILVNILLLLFLLFGLVLKFLIMKNLFVLVRKIFLKKHTQ